MSKTSTQVKKSLQDEINDRLGRWAFDSVVPPAKLMSPPLEVLKSGRLVIARLLPSELLGLSCPAIVLDEMVTRTIASWIGKYQYIDIGGDENLPLESCVNKWVDEEIAFVLLESFGKNSPNPRLLGFVAAIPGRSDRNTVEVGRLLISPDNRKSGIGQALLSNVANLLTAAVKGVSVYARVPEGNHPALDMFADIRRFKKTERTTIEEGFELTTPRETLSAEVWFKWEDAPKLNRRLFGIAFRKLREERGLTQQIVAQRTGITREALNQVENDGLPSHENVPRLLDALSLSGVLTSESKMSLLFSMFGYSIPNDVIFSNSLELTGGQSEGFESRWCLSDRPVEIIDEQEFELTVSAILKGYQRFYFIPRNAIAASYGIPLCRRISESVQRQLPGSNRLGESLERLRLYIAPSGLCRLRMMVLGPELSGGKVRPPRGISIAGPNDERIGLGVAQATRIFDDLCDAIRPSFYVGDQRNSRMSLPDGFEMIPTSEFFDFPNAE